MSMNFGLKKMPAGNTAFAKMAGDAYLEIFYI